MTKELKEDVNATIDKSKNNKQDKAGEKQGNKAMEDIGISCIILRFRVNQNIRFNSTSINGIALFQSTKHTKTKIASLFRASVPPFKWKYIVVC